MLQKVLSEKCIPDPKFSYIYKSAFHDNRKLKCDRLKFSATPTFGIVICDIFRLV